MPQTQYNDLLRVGYAGDHYDNGMGDKITLINSAPQAVQVDTVTVSGATNAKLYTLVVLGVACSYLSDASATTQEIVDGLVDAVNNEPAVSGYVVAEGTSSSTLTISGRTVNVPFTVTEDDAQLSVSSSAGALAAAVRFGAAVVKTGDRAGRLVASSDFVGTLLTLSFTAENSQPYELTLTYGGNTYQVIFTSDGSATAAEIAAGLKVQIDALALTGLVTTVSTNDLLIQAGPGQDIVIGAATGGTGDITVVRTTEASKPQRVYVAVRDDIYGESLVREYTSGSLESYPGNASMNAARSGRYRVITEESVSLSGDVFVRVTANGDLDTIGAFRSSANTGCVNLSQLYPGKLAWHLAETASLGVLQLNA